MKKVVVVALALSSLVRHAVADDQVSVDKTVNPGSPVVEEQQYGSDQQVYHNKLVAETEEEHAQAPDVADDLDADIPDDAPADSTIDVAPDTSSDVVSEMPTETTLDANTTTSESTSVQQAGAPVPDHAKSSMNGAYMGLEGALHHIGKYAPASASRYVPGAKSVNANGARLSLGYRIDDNFAVELGYLTGLSTHVENTHSQATAHVQGADLSVLYHMTDIMPGVYFRGGMSYLRADASSSVNKSAEYRDRPLHDYVHPTRYDREQRRGLGLVAGIGYETAVTEHILLNAGYTRYQGVAGDKHSAMDVVNIGAKYAF